LTASLNPELDQTLIHELVHAFLADRSRGVAPRDLHEGLAQYMEGKRLDRDLSEEQLRDLSRDASSACRRSTSTRWPSWST